VHPFGDNVTSAAVNVQPEDVATQLRPFSRLTDMNAGRVEEQLFVDAGSGRLFVTYTEPLRDRRAVAFLICHSFASEQFELFPLELLFARLAATAGFPSLYFQAQGYNDSGGDFRQVTPSSHFRDAMRAADYLRDRAATDSIVPVGARFGAAVALWASERLGSPGLALWNPALEPAKFFDGLIRAFAVSGLLGDDGAEATSGRRSFASLRAELEAGRDLDLFGYPLTPMCYQEALSMEPLEALAKGPARALILPINPANKRDGIRAEGIFRALGADVQMQVAEGPGRGAFGVGLPVGGHLGRNMALFESVARRTLAWAEEAW
jgi:hypothetical protein